MDILDAASKLEQKERAAAIARHQQRPAEKPLYIDGQRVCVDCECDISPKQVELIDAVRCIDCQQLQEHYNKQRTGK